MVNYPSEDTSEKMHTRRQRIAGRESSMRKPVWIFCERPRYLFAGIGSKLRLYSFIGDRLEELKKESKILIAADVFRSYKSF